METVPIIMDFAREARCGISEAVFCLHKHTGQIEKALSLAKEHNHRLLLTSLSAAKYATLSSQWQEGCVYYENCQCATYGDIPPLDATRPATIAIVSAGSSDASVCYEAHITLEYHGIAADVFLDRGVAGLWRLQQQIPQLKTYDIIIAVAGMEAALPTVLAGLVDAPIIAVPTSVGYGVAQGGQTALHACLASCSGGIMTMNIDNGYGAACAAIKIYKKINKNLL